MRSFLLLPLLLLSFEASSSTDSVRASKYLATMLFDGSCVTSCPEPNFPQRIDFNTTQDANGDGVVDAEDAMENLVRYAIGDSIVDTGRTGLPNRGPNDQRPAVYFHHMETDSFEVYQYWHYYADNDWINNHEHDVQFYFVYEECGQPLYILLSYHNYQNIFKWEEIAKDDGQPIFDVEAGSHGYQNDTTHDGVRIRYNGDVHERNGKLITPDSINVPWLIFSNDSHVVDAESYVPEPDTMYKGDPAYPWPNPGEYGDGRESPWLRTMWDDPPMPQGGNCPDPIADFEPFGSGYSFVFLDSARHANEWYWDLGDGTKDTGTYPLHVYDSAGTYEVCLTTVDSCRERADCRCRTIEIEDSTSSVKDHDGSDEPSWTLYPNPANDRVFVKKEGNDALKRVRVFSPEGRLLDRHDRLNEANAEGAYEIPLKEHPKGILFIELLSKEGRSMKRLLHR